VWTEFYLYCFGVKCEQDAEVWYLRAVLRAIGLWVSSAKARLASRLWH
jgi:hypothetical protein